METHNNMAISQGNDHYSKINTMSGPDDLMLSNDSNYSLSTGYSYMIKVHVQRNVKTTGNNNKALIGPF